MHCPPDDDNNWRDWAGLLNGPAGLIAERVLAHDVVDYMRFRAVCRPWRQYCTDPRSHDSLDRRFHPRRWTMLREYLATPDRCSFLNTSTGQSIQVDIPELRDHDLLALTAEGLLVLVHDQKNVCMLNPLTRQLINLPPLTTLLPLKDHKEILEDNCQFQTDFNAWGSGIARDDSTVVLCFSRLRMIGMAKPGDVQWTLIKYRCWWIGTPLMFAGRLYCFTVDGLMVLETSTTEPPRLEVAAEMDRRVSSMGHSVHHVNNCGELMLVHRRLHLRERLTAENELVGYYSMYQVDLDTRTVCPVKSLGGRAGRAVFMGWSSSLSVSLEIFPSGSISADTIYFSSGIEVQASTYHLGDVRSEEGTRRYKGNVAPRPHTLVDCISFCNSMRDYPISLYLLAYLQFTIFDHISLAKYSRENIYLYRVMHG